MKPLDALHELLDNQILVRLKNGMEIQGKLKAFDIHINLVLEDAEFKDGEVGKKFKRLFLRGDMILFVSWALSYLKQKNVLSSSIWQERQQGESGEKPRPTSPVNGADQKAITTGRNYVQPVGLVKVQS